MEIKYSLISNFFKKVIRSLTLNTLLKILFFWLVYIVIKQPLNLIIYSNIPYWVLAFIIALCISIIISNLTNKLFNLLFVDYDVLDILIIYIIYIIQITHTIIYEQGLVYVHGSVWATMPAIPYHKLVECRKYHKSLLDERRLLNYKISRLETVATALDRDRSYYTHGSLYDSFTEHARESKVRLPYLNKEIDEIAEFRQNVVWAESPLSFLGYQFAMWAGAGFDI